MSTFQRLPTSVTPINYDLTFTPDWATHTFTGRAQIQVKVNEEGTSRVVLNSKELTVSRASFNGVEAKGINTDNSTELLDIEFPVPLSASSDGTLCLDFGGSVNDTLKGFFRSKYKDAQGVEKFHYVTKFEPAFARVCFPCWDEPAIKATYDITLVVPKGLTAVSNMPVKQEFQNLDDSSKKTVIFHKSVKMSTYVMAFAIGEFDYVEATAENGVVCRVYTGVGKQERGQFALDIVKKAIPFYADYFGVPYPLPKMDCLAVNEYPCGAMENWGLVIFKELALLVDPQLSSTLTKQRVALTTTHETAHMWFGNLVTMEWWDDLWLNEGFATFMEHVCTDAIFPEFKIWETFVADCVTSALALDGLASSHPIQVVVGAPSTVGEIFDSISYDKGASVIGMLHDYIGDESFKKGMQVYLTKHQFSNTVTEDLWTALAAASGKPVDKIMPTWTKQMGYPLLSVKSIIQNGDEKVITFSYEKYWSDPTKKNNGNSSNWIIPLKLKKQSNPLSVCGEVVIDEHEGTIRVQAKENEWVKLNADMVGYFRVAYPSSILAQFIPSVTDKSMGTIDRLGLIDDLFASVVGGSSPSTDVLQLLAAYKEEDSYTVWVIILKILSGFNVIISGTPSQEKFLHFGRELLESVYSRLGWEPKLGETPQDSALRTLILAKMVGLGHSGVIQEAQDRFLKHISGEALMHPDIVPPVYRAAVVGPKAESGFASLIKLYKESDLLEEKYRILRAVGAATEESVIQSALTFGMSEDVNKQDIAVLLVNFTTRQGREAAWNFFKSNPTHFQSVFPSGGWYMRWLAGIPSNFTSLEKAAEVQEFFQLNKFTGVDRAVEQSLESIRINNAWLQRDYADIDKFLQNY